MKKSIFYLDGKYLEAAKELLETFTPGQNNYRGVFETIFVLDKKAVYLQEHLERLQEGLRVLKIKHSFTTFKLKYVVSQVIIKNPFIKPGRLRLMVFPQDKTIHCACMIVPYKAHNKKQYQEGLSAYVIKTNRPANSLNANVKSLDYAFFANALKSANEHDCDEAILMNRKGHVFETSRGNIFLFIKGQWLTPTLSSGCLNGIMRWKVIKIFQGLGVKIIERNITLAMLKQATSIIMTNSLVGVIRLNVR